MADKKNEKAILIPLEELQNTTFKIDLNGNVPLSYDINPIQTQQIDSKDRYATTQPEDTKTYAIAKGYGAKLQVDEKGFNEFVIASKDQAISFFLNYFQAAKAGIMVDDTFREFDAAKQAAIVVLDYLLKRTQEREQHGIFGKDKFNRSQKLGAGLQLFKEIIDNNCKPEELLQELQKQLKNNQDPLSDGRLHEAAMKVVELLSPKEEKTFTL